MRIGRDEKGFKINPPLSKLDSGSLDFLLVGSGDEVMMIELAVKATKDFTNFDLSNLNLGIDADLKDDEFEWKINEIDENELIDLIKESIPLIKNATENYNKAFLPLKREVDNFEIEEIKKSGEADSFILNNFKDKIFSILKGLSKSERGSALDNIVEEAITLSKDKGFQFGDDEVKSGV